MPSNLSCVICCFCCCIYGIASRIGCCLGGTSHKTTNHTERILPH